MEGPAPRSELHDARRAIRIDLGLTALALAGWATVLACPDEPSRRAALALAGGLSTLVLVRPWYRRTASRTIAAATWAAEREREHAAASAAEHAEIYRAIVDTATEGIVTIDAQGRIETVNGAAQRMFGYAAAELIGKNVCTLMPEPHATEHDSYLERYLRTGERRIIGIGREVSGRRKDGTEFPIDLSVGEGRVDDRQFFTAVLRDITERKELRAKLGQAERLAAVGELAAGVAHEINNPVNTMINCAQLIQDGDAAEENTRIIVEEGERIADIVRDLLQFARDDRDHAQPTSIPEVVQRTLRLLGESWKRHGITLAVDVPEDLPIVMARPQQVQQVLLNLLINAKDALLQTQIPKKQVTIASAIEGAMVRLEVADNGPGIAPDVAPRIFEPFVTTKRARGGTGLGLSISKSIVEGYGGRIQVHSAPGAGATFSVWLPRSPQE